MKAKALTHTLGLALFIALLAVKPTPAQKPVGSSGETETRVSESRGGGKYERTTEVFRDKVLLSKKQEVSLHDDGRIDTVFTKLYRKGQMIYASGFYRDAHRTVRSYYHEGKMLAEEGDENGDGLFTTIILFDAKERPVEAFKRSRDGTVTQFGKEQWSQLEKAFAFTAEEVRRP